MIKTPPGSAHLVASAIDHAQLAEIAGTVSGDDTMFVAVRDGVDVHAVARPLQADDGPGEGDLRMSGDKAD